MDGEVLSIGCDRPNEIELITSGQTIGIRPARATKTIIIGFDPPVY